jgi:hypothetical protein
MAKINESDFLLSLQNVVCPSTFSKYPGAWYLAKTISSCPFFLHNALLPSHPSSVFSGGKKQLLSTFLNREVITWLTESQLWIMIAT